MSRKSYPALLLVQNSRRFYFATIPVDDLFASCFVARRDEDNVAGFQRTLNESRADDIAKYLASGRGSIPSNIVLSAQETADFRYKRGTKSISFVTRKAGFLVLDGQHRLWGYQKCKVRHRVPVAVYEGLSRQDEAKLFIDINTTQRGVPAALLLDIKQVAQQETSLEQNLRTTFDRLNSDPDSALSGKLSPSKSVTGKVSRVTFNRALSSVFTGGTISETDEDRRYRLIRNYINAFDAELKDKGLLTRSSFFEAMFHLFEMVVQNTVAASKTVKQGAIQRTIQPLARLNYRAPGGHTVLDRNSIVSLMQSTLRSGTEISDEML